MKIDSKSKGRWIPRFAILIFCQPVFLWGGDKICEALYEELNAIKAQRTISIKDVERSINIAQKINLNENCPYAQQLSLGICVTCTIADIIIKADIETAVPSYFRYLDYNEGSAEEQLAYSFDRVFAKYPERTLKEISGFPKEKQLELLDLISWGFLNNYFEERENSKLTISELFFSKLSRLEGLKTRYKDLLNTLVARIKIYDKTE